MICQNNLLGPSNLRIQAVVNSRSMQRSKCHGFRGFLTLTTSQDNRGAIQHSPLGIYMFYDEENDL